MAQNRFYSFQSNKYLTKGGGKISLGHFNAFGTILLFCDYFSMLYTDTYHLKALPAVYNAGGLGA
jgi:hypothetical protein